MQESAEGANVAVGDCGQHTVDALEEPILFAVLTAQQERGERDRQRELAEQNAGSARKKGDGYEDGNQHQRGGDDGAGDLLHGVGRGFDGIGLAFLQMALDVFDDDDGIVDHEASGEGDTEQRQRVDGEAEQFDEGKSADERDWNRDGRNDRGAPVFQENEDDKDDKNDGLAEGRDYVADRFADRVGGIEGEFILHAGRKALGKAVEFGDAATVHVEGVGGGELGDTDADGFVAVVVEVGAVVFGAEFGVTDVP